jgi:predicted Zn finger-like uncharacterized protein
MLFTRCPDCDTTFRVTDEALKKANGQVRCGRCASVFNAYAELQEVDTPAPASDSAAEHQPPRATPIAPLPRSKTVGDPIAETIGTASAAEIVAEAERATAADENASTGEVQAQPELAAGDAISAEQVDGVLAASHTSLQVGDRSRWTILDTSTEPSHRSRWWGTAVGIALLTLGLQGVHHFRATLAGQPVLGPWVQRAYATLGIEVTPHWDVRQYEILDWVATAEPNTGRLGSLKITARIKNNGPQAQPYPALHLRLKDRWEEAVGNRVFRPDEYLPRDTPRGRLMAAGETTRAEIEVVDPGPDAYGFELDVCIAVETDVLSCGTDNVFL